MSETLHLEEAVDENPLINEQDLTEEQNEKAKRIRNDHRIVETPTDSWYGLHAEPGRNLGEAVDNVFGPPFDKAYDKMERVLAMRAAKKHYKKHEGAYQVQAVKDADAKGVETDFGATVIKK